MRSYAKLGRASSHGAPHGTGTLDHAPLFTDSRGRAIGETGENPECNNAYGRWVPGGDTAMHVEELAQQVLDGTLDYETAVRLCEALTDAVGKTGVADRRDLLVVLSRKREAHHDH